MRVWCSESAAKRDFMDFLADTYSTKPILVSEVRQLYNACVRNFTVANDPHSNKFSKAIRIVSTAVTAAIKTLPANIVVLDDWLDRDNLEDVDYYVMHTPEDSDPLFRLLKPDTEMAKAQASAIDAWNTLRLSVPDRLIILGYNERVRDLFTIEPEGDGGVELRLLPNAISDHKFEYKSGRNDREEAARIYGSTSVKQKETTDYDEVEDSESESS